MLITMPPPSAWGRWRVPALPVSAPVGFESEPDVPAIRAIIAARCFSSTIRVESMIAVLSSSVRRCQSNGSF